MLASDLVLTPGLWNENKIQEVFWEVDVPTLLAIPLSVIASEDKLVWHYKENGVYFVHLGHRTILNSKGETESSNPRMGHQ
ncbi:hypothetical protein PanWU01x14_246520 [Parasponia andersonii]|uniref:Uncharacterized protein n=1 Tax=Parasponia andersonii TaxID=3476 RepID=A0A2P5BED0_PARAD|nr:hypothetical protein PanWU01x14_246520 [Parasponia andersonii]